MKEADYTEQKEVLRFLVYSVGTIDVEESGGEKETIEVDVPLLGGEGTVLNRSNFWASMMHRLDSLTSDYCVY